MLTVYARDNANECSRMMVGIIYFVGMPVGLNKGLEK
jgi:hypothetical protein